MTKVTKRTRKEAIVGFCPDVPYRALAFRLLDACLKVLDTRYTRERYIFTEAGVKLTVKTGGSCDKCDAESPPIIEIILPIAAKQRTKKT